MPGNYLGQSGGKNDAAEHKAEPVSEVLACAQINWLHVCGTAAMAEPVNRKNLAT